MGDLLPRGHWRTLAYALGMGVAFVVIVALGSIRVSGGTGQFHDSDFDAFQAASAVIDAGGNPYETESIDAELAKGAPYYSEDFARFPGAQSRSFFNPPMWLTMLSVIGFSSTMLVLGGAFFTGTAVGALLSGSDLQFGPIIIPLSFLLWDRLFLWANDELGQTGYLIAGAMLWSVYLGSRHSRIAGVVGSLLSGKPHLWMAHALGTVRDRTAVAGWQVAASVVIGLISLGQFSTLWFRYLEALTDTHGELPTEQSLTVTALGSVFRSTSAVALVVVVAIAAIAFLMRADMSFGARWTLIVATVMLASTHAFWHDWAWLLGVPLILRWSMIRSAAFYLSIPIAAEVFLGSQFSNSGPVLVVVAWLASILWDEFGAEESQVSTAKFDPADQAESDGRTLLVHGQH